ncbi:MAG TPA: HAMP domain-containing sensor histidine kinase [Streptosporangiaceae bacterium]
MTARRSEPGRLRGWLRAAGLRRRLILAFVLVAAVSAGSLAVASYLLVRQARLDGSLATSAVEARQDLNLAAAIAESDADGFIQAYERRGTHALLIFPQGGRVASDPQVNPPLPPTLQRLVRQGQLGYQRMSVARQPYLVVAGQVPNSAAQLYLFFSEQSIEHNLAQLRDSLAVAWLGVLLLAALIGRALARRTLEPVARASAAARLIAGGRLDTRLTASAADEFGAWAAAFNEMADALEAKIVALSAAQARELRFTANVAHELRTPLTALVAEASLLRDQVSQLPDAARRPVELLIADVGRLKALVGELMEISRLDAGSEPVQLRLFDARSILTALISASDWQSRVTVAGEPLMLTSDPRRVERILTNLIGNAVEHTSGDVVVHVASDGSQARVDVTDAGPGIAAEHVPHVFERFYKADSARTGAGSGLGLAIALENARLLGGNISVRSDVERGSVFRLTLPMGPAHDVRKR